MPPEKWEVVVYLTPSRNPDDVAALFYEFPSRDEALAFAQSAATSAHAISEPGSSVAVFYPAHRVEHVVLRDPKG